MNTSRTLAAALALSLAALASAPPALVAQGQQVQQADPPEVGAVAPGFTVRAATRYGVLEQPVSLGDFAGKTVVLAFFPRARTQGCTIQMHAYRDQYAELFRDGQDVVLIAMSTDSAEDLHAWARDDQFQFLMASDMDGAVARQYGASLGRISNRYLFVIGPDGRIAHRMIPFAEVDPTSYTLLAEALDRVVTTASR